jgi:hypothetical protein
LLFLLLDVNNSLIALKPELSGKNTEPEA